MTNEVTKFMTREDSILTRTWVTNDGRYLGVAEIADDHLRAIRSYLRQELTHGLDESACRAELAAWMIAHAAGVHAVEDEMDHDLFRAGWIQITSEEIARRSSWA
jgi:hypothetical protein